MKKLFAKPERPEELQTPFAYGPLKSNEIRLLRLNRSPALDSSKPLSGSLKTIRFQDRDDYLFTQYEALSYCWGDETDNRTLLLDNTPFSIKPNLEAALRVLSKGSIAHVFWIDAICINQDDKKERSEQVRMMGSIYRQAKRVIVWLGPYWPWRPGKKYHAPKIIKDFAERQRNGADFQQLCKFLDNPHDNIETKGHMSSSAFNEHAEVNAVEYSGGRWPYLMDFFDQPWWRRVWVRQELAMSQQAIVQCGDKTVDWTDVAAICHWLKVWIPDLDEKLRWRGRRYHRSGAYSGEDLEDFRQTLDVKGKLELTKMLIHARDCESTDARDKVYSILGLTGDDANDIVINYSLPVSAVAIQAFRKQADQNKSLDALIWSQNPSKQEGIPTWAPNLYSHFISQPSRLKGKDFSLYAAAGILPSTERFAFLEDGIPLEVDRVTIFDRVAKLSQVLSDSRHITDSQLDDAMFKWKPLVFKWLGSMDIDQKYERFMSALTCDRAIRGRRLPKGVNGVEWATHFRISHNSVGARTEFEFLVLAVRMSMFQGTTSGQTELSDWLKLCAESVGGRKIIMTAEGRIGLVPAQTREGDVVCILGLDVPFILRAIDVDTYMVIGEAYIHGVMDGEIVNARSASYVQEVRHIRLQ